MSEQLLTIDQVAGRLGVSRSSVKRNIVKLRARGLQRVPVGKRLVRYRESSLDGLIKRAAEREESLA